MTEIEKLDRIAITVRSHKLLRKLLAENPELEEILSFRVIGITRYGRRILEFDHDETRRHSPIIRKMGKVVIIESKSIHEYLNQHTR